MPGLQAGTRDRVRVDAEIRTHPAFVELIRTRRGLSWALTAAMLVIYFGFVFLVAFAPAVMATPISSTITLGFLLGLGVIVSAIALTGVYVLRANAAFDTLTRRIVENRP